MATEQAIELAAELAVEILGATDQDPEHFIPDLPPSVQAWAREHWSAIITISGFVYPVIQDWVRRNPGVLGAQEGAPSLSGTINGVPPTGLYPLWDT
jgi:hypothetical protein